MNPMCWKAGKARRRGGKASKRGLSDEQVPVLVAADRSGATVSAVLPAVNADPLREVIAPVVDEDIVLVTDGHRADPRCAAAIGAHREALNLSRRERVRGALHIQIAADPAVNNRHGRLKDFLRRYRGVATRYPDNYLRWFQRLEPENASPRACLATAIARPCIQFAKGKGNSALCVIYVYFVRASWSSPSPQRCKLERLICPCPPDLGPCSPLPGGPFPIPGGPAAG